MNRNGTFVTDKMDRRRESKVNTSKIGITLNNEEIVMNVCESDVRRNRYYGNEAISREQVTSTVKKLKNCKPVGIDAITGEMTKNENNGVIG